MNKDEIRDMAIIISGSTELDTMNYYSARYKAKALIDVGYRKIEVDEIVIKKRQYEQLKKYNRDRKRLRLKWQQAKQETAREIFQALKKQGIIYCHFDRDEHLVITMDRLKALAQKYGIGLEDKDNDDK